MRSHTVIDSPVGALTLVAQDGAIVGLYMDLQRHRPADDELGELDRRGRRAEPLKSAADQLDAYFAGTLTRFTVPLAPRGTGFQQRVWAALQEIPYGETESYGQLAERIGSPGAARAVGLANGKNPIGIVIPCHRVVGSNGNLTGYGGGLDRKKQLLDLELEVSGAALF
ncbi:MAG TPA: methylated-DNA--[protein]-cysteine S-methyltransferase [Dermatophilaceae bacterium]|jgi:methylated-DNA-[protein]-cysteine S-methyltransferase|nr:methylated-DNA--[protein]-cysteine S-methyltransferase [Dermatophilaceae bacterium]